MAVRWVVSFAPEDSSSYQWKTPAVERRSWTSQGSSPEQTMTTQDNQVSVDKNTRKAALNRCLEGFGWAVLLIVVGTIWLLPETQLPHGSWLIAAGLIMLGLNAIRYFNGIRMSSFSLVVGIVALIIGLGAFFGVKLPLIAIALIVIGVGILLKAMLEKDSMSRTGHGWNCCGEGQPTGNRDRTGQAVGR